MGSLFTINANLISWSAVELETAELDDSAQGFEVVKDLNEEVEVPDEPFWLVKVVNGVDNEEDGIEIVNPNLEPEKKAETKITILEINFIFLKGQMKKS